MALSFDDVIDDSIIFSLLNGIAFEQFVETRTGGGAGRTRLDLERRLLTFEPRLAKREDVQLTVHLVARLEPASEHVPNASLAWAWADPELGERPISQMSTRIRDFGQGQQIDRFARSGYGFTTDLDLEALKVAAASARITGLPVAHVQHEAGRRSVVLLDPANFQPRPPAPQELTKVLQGAINLGLVHDHRRAIQGFAGVANLPYQWSDGFGSVQLQLPEGPVEYRFDPSGMLVQQH